MRVQSDQAKKPQKGRETRMMKLADKQAKERTNSLDNAEDESRAYDFIHVSLNVNITDFSRITSLRKLNRITRCILKCTGVGVL